MRQPRLLALSTLAALTLPVAAQSPRPSVQVSVPGSSNAGQVGVASADDLTAIVWSDTTSNQVMVTATDGRGLDFVLVVRVDADTASKTTPTDSVHVAGDAVYVFWEASSGLWFARSTDRGLNYTTPVALAIGGGNLRDWRIEISVE